MNINFSIISPLEQRIRKKAEKNLAIANRSLGRPPAFSGRCRVGLLNIGTEDSKGGPLQREAYALLKQAGDQGLMNFTGTGRFAAGKYCEICSLWLLPDP